MYRVLLAGALFASLPLPAFSQHNYFYQQVTPNYGYGNYRYPGGSIRHQRQNIGNTQFDTFSGPGGSVRCTTQYIGSMVYQNCN